MKPRPLRYVRATGLEHAVAELVEAGGDARVLAGGQSLVPLLAMRRVTPTVVVDLGVCRSWPTSTTPAAIWRSAR